MSERSRFVMYEHAAKQTDSMDRPRAIDAANSITEPDSLRSGTKKVCSVTGSTPAQNITKYLKNKATHLVLFDLVGAQFTQEPYGIGLKKGDLAFRGFVNDVLEKAAKDGRYANAWATTAGKHDRRQIRPPANSTAGKFDTRTPTVPAVNRY